MILLNFIPDLYLQYAIFVVIGIGLILYLFSIILAFFPAFAIYKSSIRSISIIIILAGVYFFGGYGVEMEWREKAKIMQGKIDIAEAKSKNLNSLLAKKSKEKSKRIHVRRLVVKQYITKEITKYDNTCVIPDVFVKAHNNSAEAPK
jgi:hypothetical protein